MQYKSTIQKLPKSEVEFSVELPYEEFETFREQAVSDLGKEVEIDGFRKGKVPKEVLETKLSEMVILEEMANHAVSALYPLLLKEHAIDTIGYPAVKITKIGKGSPLSFTMRCVVMPELILPDYKKIAREVGKKTAIEIKDEEVEKAIEDIRKMRAQENRRMKESEEEQKPESERVEVAEVLPELTDEFVKTLGNFETVDDFKVKLKENMRLEKEHMEREKNRVAIVEKITTDTSGEIPDLMIESELDKMLFRMKSDITNMGLQFEEYLKHLKKTEEELRNEFRADAEKRAKTELILHLIGEKENITPDKEETDKQVNSLLEMYKEADPIRTRGYVEMTLINEAIFKMLEAESK